MEFKDYYGTLGIEPTATPEQVKRSFRKLARKFHPDVSKEPDAERRFKDVAEAYKALKDPERRAAYDAAAQRHRRGERFDSALGPDNGFEFRGNGADGGRSQAGLDPEDVSEFFASLFGRTHRGAHVDSSAFGDPYQDLHAGGGDRHAKIAIDLNDVYHGARRKLSVQVPHTSARGRVTLHERQLEVTIPRGMRAGQTLRLAGQGEPGTGKHAAGDLYLEIELQPHPTFRVDGHDVYFELPVSPWEAALGAQVTAPTPTGPVQLTVPAGSATGRTLRLKGRGVPGEPSGDLYARLALVLPAADSDQAKEAYGTLARAFPDFAPRSTIAA
jgi:curved DNA-binding protein